MATTIHAELLLQTSLSLAVPLCVESLRQRPWDDIAQRMPELSRVLSHDGDQILYRSRKPGETARAFTALVEAIAALSFAPGGVRAFGMHWESRHPEVPRPADAGNCSQAMIQDCVADLGPLHR
jgi:hypothetical protein